MTVIVTPIPCEVSFSAAILPAAVAGSLKTALGTEWDFDYNDVVFVPDYEETDACQPDMIFDGSTLHIYNTGGEFKVALKVTDEDGATDIDTVMVYVNKHFSHFGI